MEIDAKITLNDEVLSEILSITNDGRYLLRNEDIERGVRMAASSMPWVLGAILKDGGDIQLEVSEELLQLCLQGKKENLKDRANELRIQAEVFEKEWEKKAKEWEDAKSRRRQRQLRFMDAMMELTFPNYFVIPLPGGTLLLDDRSNDRLDAVHSGQDDRLLVRFLVEDDGKRAFLTHNGVEVSDLDALDIVLTACEKECA